HNIWHSGTVAAAKQAAFLGIRAIAFSARYSDEPPDYDLFAPHVREVIDRVTSSEAPILLNVNFPDDPKGVLWTNMSVRHYEGFVIPGEDPMGRRHYWFAEEPRERLEEGTDRWAVENGFVSITPLRLALTDEVALRHARAFQPAS